MNDNHTMNIAYSLNRDYLPYLLISMYSLLTAGKGERNLRILLLVDQDLTREDLSPLFRMVSRFPGCTLEAKWPLSLTARRFVSVFGTTVSLSTRENVWSSFIPMIPAATSAFV